MWNRRDQVQAYQFLRHRVVAALTQGDPNTGERPGRRLTVAAASGAAVAVLALAVSGVLGIVRHSAPNAWADGSKVIVERETGARFVVDRDGVLRPVLNYASALLFIGRPAGVVTVGRDDLATRRRGLAIGIPGAPDTLPASGALLSGPWTTCSQARLDQTGVQRPQLALSVGYPVPGGTALTRGTALVVEDAVTGRSFVVTQGTRYAVSSPDVLTLLGLDASATRAVPVSGGWLSTLPQGGDLGRIQVADAGRRGPRLGGMATHVGQVFTRARPGLADQLYVLLADGLRPVEPLTATLVMAGSSDHQTTPTPLDARALRAPLSRAPLGEALPAVLPAPAPLPRDQVALCATWTDPASGAPPQLTELPATPEPPGISAPPTEAGAGRTTAADVVTIPPAHGALVRAPCPAGCFGAMAPFLVTDAGVQYALGDDRVLAALGYGDSTVRALPTTLLALLPQGPRLYPGGVRAPRSGDPVLTMPATGGRAAPGA